MDLTECNLPRFRAAIICEVIVDEARFCKAEHISKSLDRGIRAFLNSFQNQSHKINTQNTSHIRSQIFQKVLELDRIKHSENGAMDLIGSGKILIGGCYHRAMRVF